MASKQYVVIGLGHFGSSVAQTLYKLGNDVLAIDSSEEAVENISDFVTSAVQADATDENALKSLGLSNFEVAIIAMGSDIQSSILVTVLVKELGIKYVIVKSTNELCSKILSKIGADRVILPERDMGIRVARNLSSSNMLDYIELSPDYSIAEISARPNWLDIPLSKLDLRAKYGINVIAIKRENKIIVSPTADDRMTEGDVLAVIATNEDLDKMGKLK